MTDQETALVGIASLLETNRIPYMVIGGLANAVWGEPRATLDINVTVWVEDPAIAALIEELEDGFRVLAGDPVAFVRETRALPLESGRGVRIDVVFGVLPLERDAVERAVQIPVAGAHVRFCTAEDLILMKLVSSRARDLADAEGVAMRRMGDLDLAYLEPKVRELSALLGRPEIAHRWAVWRANAAAGH